MLANLSPIDRAKLAAARHAVGLIENGMRVGLGTGSTAAWMVRCLAERVQSEGLDLTCAATSERTAHLAAELGLNVVSLDEAGWLDITIDGTDEFDPDLNLIKGGGAAHLREKIVATASDRMVVIADPGKRVAQLGAFPLPVEVLAFGMTATRRLIEEILESFDVLGREITLRMDGEAPLVTDEGNHVLDLHLGRIGNPRQLALVLNQVPGVVENGLFIDICDQVIVGHPDGRVEIHDHASAHSTVAQGPAEEPENIFADLGD